MDHEDVKNISSMLIRLFDHWELSEQERLVLLGLTEEAEPPVNENRLVSLLLDKESVQQRGTMLLNIHRSLRLLFPNNIELAYAWVSQPNRAFGGLSAVQLIRQKGATGFKGVQSYLHQQLF